jgi:methylphosphotriester-DNA--protein-cysteine methyltransferase
MYARHNPAPPLSAFVECFWYWEGSAGTAERERLLPTGQGSVIFNLLDDAMRLYSAGNLDSFESYSSAMWAGALSTPNIIDNQQKDRVFGIQFRSGGVYPFVKMPVDELANCALPLEALWGRAAAELREQLLAAETPDAMFCATERALLSGGVRPLELHGAVRHSLQCFQRPERVGLISKFGERLGLSQRRFIELFRTQAGLTPKAYCRVRRFHNLLRVVHPLREVDWSQVALDSGYHDQAHFIHEFREFSGFSPTHYWQRRIEHLNHVPI